MAAEEHALTSTEYIKHHLTNMTYGKMVLGSSFALFFGWLHVQQIAMCQLSSNQQLR